MKLADDYAKACFDQALRLRIIDDKPEAARKKLEKELRRLRAHVQELEAQLIAEAARTAEQKLRADQLEQQHDMQAKMHAQAAEQLAAAQQGVRKGVLVDAGALQMVVNALRRDAEEGKHARGEMADELLAYATHPTPQGLDAKAIERAAQKLAEIAEYNWAQLTEKQREEFRTDALSALTAALGLGHE